MKILVACEFSGIVRDAFIRLGHDAMSCDLLDTELPGLHHQGDVLDILNEGWDLMIAHPPCTYLSNAGARHLYPDGKLNNERYLMGMEAKNFFMELFNANIPMIAIENPVPSKVFGLPQYAQIVQPWQFGHPYQKKTCLWLKNLSLLKPTNITDERQSTKVPGNWYNKGGLGRQKNRAKTFTGIAAAMAAQWGDKNETNIVQTDQSEDKRGCAVHGKKHNILWNK